MITGIDHVRIAMPRGREPEARDFFARLLGLTELQKSGSLAARGGLWFGLPDGRQLHLGAEEPFGPSKKAHPAFVVSSLDELAPGRRFYGEDPFGNRLEFLEASG